MSEKPQNRLNRRFKALIRWADYQASKPVLWALTVKPRPCRLTPYERWQFKRWLFWKHGGSECMYCRLALPLEFLTIDHIEPVSRGGAMRDVQNMALACLGCNRDKRSEFNV